CVLQFQDLAFDVYGDLVGEVAFGDGGGDFGDVTNLRRQVARHRVHGVGEVFPGAGHAGHDGLAAALAFGADFARHARHLRRERAQLVDHRVDRLLELENLPAHVHGDLLGEVVVGHADRNLGNVAHLGGEVGSHRVDVVGQVLPGAAHVGDLCLAAQFAFG